MHEALIILGASDLFEGIRCPELNLTNAVVVEKYEMTYLSTVNVTCLPGYENRGGHGETVLLTCVDNGTWSSNKPLLCERKTLVAYTV
jgi:Sushi repeat (SCR repeat)